MKRYLLSAVAIFLISLESLANGGEQPAFRYGPKFLEGYKVSSGVISSSKLPAWLEGQWWARYYSEASGTALKNIPRNSNQTMGRPFEFYGWLVRVPRGASGHIDYKVVKTTKMKSAGAWVLNIVLIENPSKGAVLVINRDAPRDASREHIIMRWRHGVRVEQRAIFAASSTTESILSNERIRMDYLQTKYISSESPDSFDYQAWHSSAISAKKKGAAASHGALSKTQ